ncbi:MAG: CheR family methyltransferase [Bacteroidota bacterium]|nr:CheR family methyltransferase [Bacteroidota bacterium]
MQNRNFKKLTMSKKDFNRLSEFITFKFGIKLPENKKVLLESRLRKRVLELGFESYSQYTNHLFTDDGLQNEIVEMIDRVSTNKTDFFREEQHFYFLKENILPRFYKNTPNKKFKVWSAGCSSGEEAYTIAIVLEEFALENVGFDYEIMGTDISQSVLKKSAVAVYPEKRIDDISLSIKKKYFLVVSSSGKE